MRRAHNSTMCPSRKANYIGTGASDATDRRAIIRWRPCPTASSPPGRRSGARRGQGSGQSSAAELGTGGDKPMSTDGHRAAASSAGGSAGDRPPRPLHSGEGPAPPATLRGSGPLVPISCLAAGITYLLIVMGAIVRASGSGLGCPDWPLCYGQVVPPGHPPAVIEFTHRLIGGIAGLLIAATLVLWAHARGYDRRVLVASALIALLLASQVGLGAVVVRLELPPPLVLVHLGLALLLLGAMVALAVGAANRSESSAAGRDTTNSTTRKLVIGAAVAVYVLVLTGAYVRATGASGACIGFPTCNGDWLPFGANRLVDIHLLHRLAAAIVGAHLVVTIARVWTTERHLPGVRQAAAFVGFSLLAQLAVGAVAVSSGVPPLAQVLHVAGAAALWGSTVALVVLTREPARQGSTVGDQSFVLSDHAILERAPSPSTMPWLVNEGISPLPPRTEERVGVRGPTLGLTLGAYLNLTKPRIVVLLLATTLGSMFLAAQGLPPVQVLVMTLLGGALGAGGANAINCWFDRDIDAVMGRTALRAIPSGVVSPARALVLGVSLAATSFVVLALFVNVLSAVLTLGALAFYVVVYTRWLKRTTAHNIVIGGAAGAVPPLVGWAAVTGEVGLLPLYLFAIVFFWTPPHFWALSLLIKHDYARAGVPMLPVVWGDAETRRQICLYSVQLVAVTALAFGARLLGPVYLAAALVLGAILISYTVQLLREGTALAARRVFRYSIVYLPLLFAAMVADQRFVFSA
ncbi:MAG: protoheme IX farnesyltransferase [Chloroflexi bacterium]|nr:protoheme IX farnesyltransferase [Chloroflexota bacterium]